MQNLPTIISDREKESKQEKIVLDLSETQKCVYEESWLNNHDVLHGEENGPGSNMHRMQRIRNSKEDSKLPV